jgi:hypothetical protein
MMAEAEEKDDDEQVLVLNRIQTVVRVRPVLPHESSQQVAVSCSSDGSSVQVELPAREYTKPALAAATKPDAKSYQFDACLTGSTTQVTEMGGRPHAAFVASTLNVCVGQQQPWAGENQDTRTAWLQC